LIDIRGSVAAPRPDPALHRQLPRGADFDDADNLDLRIHYFRQAGWMQGLLLLALLSGSMGVRAIEGRWNISLADVLRFAAMVTLLPGIVSRRPAIHAAQMIVLMLILVVALLQVAEPIA